MMTISKKKTTGHTTGKQQENTNKNDKKDQKIRNKKSLLSKVDESTLDPKTKKYYQIAISFWELLKSNLKKLNISGSEVERANFIVNIHYEVEMVSLTDLWKAAGSDKDKTPNDWRNIDANKQLIETVASMLNTVPSGIIKSKRGKGGGTIAHKQIALAYAKYLDPKLHVLVNQIFFERVEEEKYPND